MSLERHIVCLLHALIVYKTSDSNYRTSFYERGLVIHWGRDFLK